ncbi:MAG: DNA polymerase II [Nanoarchaeota archaeon]
MKGFIVYPTYRIVQDETSGKEKALVYLFGRLENGESFLTISTFRPYFFIKKSDLKTAKEIKHAPSFAVEENGFRNFKSEEVVKILLDTPKQVPDLRGLFENKKILCYEADIRFPYRFMMDKEVLGSLDIEGKFKKGTYVDRIYEEPDITPAEWFPKLRILSIDIETDQEAKEIWSISMVLRGGKEDYERVFIVSDKKLRHATSYASEEQVLVAFKEKLIELDPDVIIGWNLIDFDLKVIEEKFKKYKINFFLGRADWNCSLKLYNEFFRESTADFPGRQVLNGIWLLKTSFIKLEDYKLGTAAHEFLGKHKLIGEENKGHDIEHAYKENQQLFADYNLTDSKLTYEIIEKTGALDLTIQRSLLTGMPLERVRASIASLDSLYLRELRKRGIVAHSSQYGEKDQPTKGGFVMKSKPGIYEYILVLDFKSLYPSIIRTFNIDPLSYAGMHVKAKKVIKAANGACFTYENGILPQLIQHLWKQRDEAKRKKDKRASYAIKILMNSFYGVLANPTCRFYSSELANAITHTGQFLIKLTAEKVEEMGYEVIYSDTDSVFVKSGAGSEKEAEQIGKNIQDAINEFYKKYIKENHGRESFMELEFEKNFKKFMMPTVRYSEVGAKKRYAGLLVKDGKESMEFTGLEFVRSDWTELSKKFQMELLDKIFHEKEVAKFIKEFAENLKRGKYDELLVYRKSIRKELAEYTKTTPPHVKAARILEKAGRKIESTVIKYYMTTNGPEPVELHKSPIDYEHYIDKQIKPLADAVLSFYSTSFEDVMKNSKQRTLFGY